MVCAVLIVGGLLYPLLPLLIGLVQYRKADIALGHEGAGVVEQLGPDVKYLRKGDRVGWGYEHDSCGHCQQCLKGEETYCPQRAMYGGYEGTRSPHVHLIGSSPSRHRPRIVRHWSCLARGVLIPDPR